MMKILYLLLVLMCYDFAFAQDLLIPDNPYEKADDYTKSRKAFQREKWFNEQRMYPNNFIPEDAYRKAYEQKEQLRMNKGFAMNGIFDAWTNIGPTTGFYFSYSNITSRMPTIKYDPVDPSVIYIGAAFGGVWKSTNGGTNWTPKSDFEVSLSSGSIAIDPTNTNIIYYGTGEATYSGASYYGRGVLKSTNGGDTWTSYTAGLPSSTYTSRIVVRPNNPNEIFAAMGTAGLYKSTNGGVSWSIIISGRCDDVIFKSSGDTAYITGSGTGYRISVDGGSIFTSSPALTMGTRNHIAVSKSSPNILYFARYSGSTITVYKSNDGGVTFSQIVAGQNFNGGQAWYDFYIHVNPFDPNYAYVGAVDVWRTTNGGTSNFSNITLAYSGGNVHPDQHNIDFHPSDPDQMICVNDGGIWKSTNRGSSWTNMNTNLTLTQFYRIAADPSNPNHILGGTQDNGTQRTTGALNWTAAYGGDGGEVCFHAVNNSYILGETQNNGVFRSTNGGASFSSATSGLSGSGAWVAPLLSHPDSAGIFYTARASVFKTTNWAANWTPISSGTGGTIREMAISKSNPAIMFATSSSLVYKSTNRGYTFTNVGSGLPSRTITSINVHPDSSDVVIVTHSGFGGGHIYKSTNGGISFFNISSNLPDSPANDAVIYHPGVATSSCFVATDVGVFVSLDYGQSWTELADGLPNTVAMHLDYHKATNKMRIGTHGRGVYEIQLDNFVQANITVIPEGFYNQDSNSIRMKDTVRAYLRSSVSPYTIKDSAKNIIDSISFSANFTFNNATAGSYYLVVMHRNSIETWSKSGGELFNPLTPLNYDFTAGASRAYGNNLQQVDTSPVRFGIYGGDVNRDDAVDLSDITLIFNDAEIFENGYVLTDVTGDSQVDLSDLILTFNNSANFVVAITP